MGLNVGRYVDPHYSQRYPAAGSLFSCLLWPGLHVCWSNNTRVILPEGKGKEYSRHFGGIHFSSASNRENQASILPGH